MSKGIYIGVDNIAHKVKKGYIGVDGIARKIKKAYIGIGGVARPCFSRELEYYGAITPLNGARSSLAATTVGDYALFGGGRYATSSSAQVKATVDAYDKSLIRTSPATLGDARSNLAATTVGDYALFGGGGDAGASYKKIYAYDKSLVRTVPTASISQRSNLAATTVGDYALFGGGTGTLDYYDNMDAYDISLTKVETVEVLSLARYALAATTVGDYALFGGGIGKGSGTATVGDKDVDAYDTSLTHTIPTKMAINRSFLAATTIGNYALFAGSFHSNALITPLDNRIIDVYDRSLTRTNPISLSQQRIKLAATTAGDYALFGGGIDVDDKYCDTVDVYDTSLTHTIATKLSAQRCNLAATTVGDYALFGGGSTGTYKQSDVVEAYKI